MRLPSRRPDPPLRRLGPRLSRRGLLTSAMLAGVLAASGVAVQARPRGGTLRLAVAGSVPQGADGWDTRENPLMGVAAGLVAETLTEIGADGGLLPALALAWESDGAARDWRLTLAPARFHDGAPLTPGDVAASLALHRDGPLAALLAGIDDVRPDGDAVRLRLTREDPDLPLRLADPRLAVWRDGRPDGVGTGLYRLDPDAPAGALRAVRVASHRRDGEAGHFDAVEVRAIPDPEARLAALLSGEAHAADPLPGLEARLLAENLRLAGPTPHAAALAHGPTADDALDGGRLPERWWFAA